MDDNGIKFLDKLYGNLYMSDVVQHTKETSDNRVETIRKYLERIEKLHKFANTDARKEYVLNMYFDKYVIKEENIPLGVDKEQVIAGQKKKLAMWIDYLTDPNSSYPMWAKYWAFQGMLKMGSYDEVKSVYLKRDKKTVAPFIDPNPEIIAKSISVITKLVNGEEIDDVTELRLNKTDSFSKIYSAFEKKYKENIVEKSKSDDGVWIKYNQGSKKDAIRLSKSLENKNCGWCTACEDVAISQVCGPYNDAHHGGDFYVYYTKDKDGKYTIPRIAIRLNGKNFIGEIRGINEGQNLEPELTGVLEDKLHSIPGLDKKSVERNLEIVASLRKLLDIKKRTEVGDPLSQDQIIALYTETFGFGWNQDPEVFDIIKKRNSAEDYKLLPDVETKAKMLGRCRIPQQNAFTVDNKDVMLKAVDIDPYAIMFASDKLKDDEDIAKRTIYEDARFFHYFSERIRDNEVIANLAISRAVFAPILEDLSPRLRDNKEIVLRILKKNGSESLKYVSDRLKHDPDVLIAALRTDTGFQAVHIPNDVLDNKEIMTKVISKCPYLFECLPYGNRDDKDLALAAVKCNCREYSQITKRLKKDVDILATALMNPRAIESISRNILPEFKVDKDLVLQLLDKGAKNYLGEVSEKLRDDPEVVMKAVINYGYDLQYASERLRNIKGIVLAAVANDGKALQFASNELKKDKDIVIAAVNNDSRVIIYASPELRNDSDIMQIIEADKERMKNKWK